MTETLIDIPELITGSDCSGVGALDQALNALGIKQRKLFACDMDKFSRQTYVYNYGTQEDWDLLKHPDVMFIDNVYYREYNSKDNKKPTQEEWDIVRETEEEVARRFSFYFPWNMYSRQIPTEPLDFYGSTVPCQAFSMAGKRDGEADRRGILFYNSHEFIQKNKPRAFFFENVKGLLSDDKGNPKDEIGRTFRRWLDFLGGKSVNGNPVIFPHPESVPYHIYWAVLNSKDFGVPQNRERVFIFGIRDDEDNDYKFPKPVHLKKRLRDILEQNVEDKYFLSDEMLEGFMAHADRHSEKGNNFGFDTVDVDGVSNTITNPGKLRQTDNYIKEGYINQDTQSAQVFSEEGISPTIQAGTKGYCNGYVKETAPEIIKAGQITKEGMHESSGRVYDTDGIAPTITAKQGGGHEPYIEVKGAAIRGRYVNDPKSRKSGQETKQILEINANPDISNTLTTVEKDNVILVKSNTKKGYEEATIRDSINIAQLNSKTRRGRVGSGVANTLETSSNQAVVVPNDQVTESDDATIIGYTRDAKGKVTSRHEKDVANTITGSTGGGGTTDQFLKVGYRIRRLTPRECFRLMGFPDSFTWPVSDSQAYKQSGNSIVIHVLKAGIKKLPFIKNYQNHG